MCGELWLRLKCWALLSCKMCNNGLLCAPTSVSSRHLPPQSPKALSVSAGSNTCHKVSSATAPRQQLSIRPWFSKQALFSAAPMICPAYKMASVESVILFWPLRALENCQESFLGVTRVGEERVTESERERMRFAHPLTFRSLYPLWAV